MGRQTEYRLTRYLFRAAVVSALLLILQAAFPAFREAVWCEEAQVKPDAKFAGSFFGVPVPEENYYFVKSVVMVFGNKYGPRPKTEKEIEDAVWDQLLLSYEAFRRNIVVSPEELDKEVGNMLSAENVTFNRKIDKTAYDAWLKTRVNEPAALFENQIRHLIQIQKLKDDVMKGIDTPVTDAEAHEGFLNENSSLDLELVQFDAEKDGLAFYNKVRGDNSTWDKEKDKRPKDFKRPGGVTVQFLWDFWKIPVSAQHEMVGMKPGEFHKPEPIYKGWGVFKVLGSKKADESTWPGSKERYVEKVKAGKRYGGYNDWFKNMKQAADIKVYKPAEGDEVKNNNQEQKKEGKR